MLPSTINEPSSNFFPLDFCKLRKYFVPFSPSWYHLDFIRAHINSPISSRILSLLQVTSSSLTTAKSLKLSDDADSNADCQNFISFLRFSNFLFRSFLWLLAISMAIDLIDIFKYSSCWCGFIFVSDIWSILRSSSTRNLCFNCTLLMKEVSILTILSLRRGWIWPNLTITAQWSDCVYDQSVSVLISVVLSSSDHCILSSLDIFSPCLHVICSLAIVQQSTIDRSLKSPSILSAHLISVLDLIVPFLSPSRNVVLKSPIKITLASVYFSMNLSISNLTPAKKSTLSWLCAHGECMLARIISCFCESSRISNSEICASLSISNFSRIIILSLSRLIIPPFAPSPGVKTCWPFHVYLRLLYSTWVSCNETIRFLSLAWDWRSLLISCLNFCSFFRPLQLIVTSVRSRGPGFNSTSPLRSINLCDQDTQPIILSLFSS